MKITRTSILSGETRTMELDVTDVQLWNWEAGMLAQDAFPSLTPDEREFIISGVTAEEWEAFAEVYERDDDASPWEI